MKKLLLSLVVLLAFSGISEAQFLLERRYWNWNSSYNEWHNTSRYDYDYDTNERVSQVTKLLIDVVNPLNWNNSQAVNYNYNISGQLVSTITQDYDNNQWVNEERVSNTYNGNGELDTNITEEWDNSAWVNKRRSVYTYDSIGNQVQEFTFDWDASGNAWKQKDRKNSTYAGGYLVETITERWRQDSAAWVNYFKLNNSYNVNNQIDSFINRSWNQGVWENYTLSLYYYDSTGFSYTHYGFIWEAYANNNQWDSINFVRYVYNPDNTRDSIIAIVKSPQQVWGNSSLTTYHYGPYEQPDAINEVHANQLSIYPNPTSNWVAINLDNEAPANLTIFSAEGRMVDNRKLMGTTNEVFLGHLPAGFYLVQVVQEGKAYSTSIVKQ